MKQKTGWKANDLTVTRIITMLGNARLECYVNQALTVKKSATQKLVV